VLLIVEGIIKLIWGLSYRSVLPPPALGGSIQMGGLFIPTYSLFVIAVGILAFVLLDLIVHRMWFGKVIQSVASDQWMASILGVNVRLVFTSTVMIAFFLAGLAGGVMLPNQSLTPFLSHSYLLLAFVVVIVGGLGSIRGAFAGSLLLGLVESLNSVVMPDLPGLAIYFAMIAVLLWRPQGLFAREESKLGGNHVSNSASVHFNISRGTAVGLGAAVALILLTLPLWANPGIVFLTGIMLIDAVFALAWNILYGFTGLAAFGHAAFFALGGYFLGFFLKAGTISFLTLLLGSAVLGAVLAYLSSFVALKRTTGIALAILTLALSEIVRIVLGYFRDLGNEDGLSGIPRPRLDFGLFGISLQSNNAYYWFLCVACALLALAMWWLMTGQFGRALLSIRQDAERAEFLGLNTRGYRIAAFTISGSVATIAGALQSPWTQIVSPELADYLHSTQPMLNALLGGAEYFWGPALGAALFALLSFGTRTLAGLSDVISGGIILAVILVSPAGVLGMVANWTTAWSRKSGVDKPVSSASPTKTARPA
jgi:branched-chain amino acid transport system permease protein